MSAGRYTAAAVTTRQPGNRQPTYQVYYNHRKTARLILSMSPKEDRYRKLIMARVKHTDRKKTQPMQQARKDWNCMGCDKAFGQKANYLRHLALIHDMDEEGKPICQAERARYAAYAKRGKREEAQPTSTEKVSSPKKQQKSRKKLTVEQPKDEPADYPRPDDGPDRPLPRKQRPTAATKGRKINRAEPIPDAVIRKPTRPSLPSSRKVRRVISAPPKMTENISAGPSKRRLEMAPSVLAKKVAHRHGQSSRKIADELASKYGMPAQERRMNENIIRGMRAAQRHLCSRIRRHLPLNRTSEDIDRFLTTMENDCRKVEEHDSDEFV